jgi:hypothetical protein
MAAESKLQTRIRKDLERDGWYVVKISICNKPGYPDLQAMKSRRRMAYIEVKGPGKKSEPLQEYVHDILRKIGFSVFVIDSWEKYLFIKASI